VDTRSWVFRGVNHKAEGRRFQGKFNKTGEPKGKEIRTHVHAGAQNEGVARRRGSTCFSHRLQGRGPGKSQGDLATARKDLGVTKFPAEGGREGAHTFAGGTINPDCLGDQMEKKGKKKFCLE